MSEKFYDMMLEMQNRRCNQCVYKEGEKCSHIKTVSRYHAPSNTYYEECENYKSKGDN